MDTILVDADYAEKVKLYEAQTAHLADVIMKYFPHEPGKVKDESAVETATRLLTDIGIRNSVGQSTK